MEVISSNIIEDNYLIRFKVSTDCRNFIWDHFDYNFLIVTIGGARPGEHSRLLQYLDENGMGLIILPLNHYNLFNEIMGQLNTGYKEFKKSSDKSVSAPVVRITDCGPENAITDCGSKDIITGDIKQNPKLPQFKTPDDCFMVNKSRTRYFLKKQFYMFVREHRPELTQSGTLDVASVIIGNPDRKYTLKWIEHESGLMELRAINMSSSEKGVEIFQMFEKLLALFKLSDDFECY